MERNLNLIFNESGRSIQLIIEDGEARCGSSKRTIDGDTYLPATCLSFYRELLKLFIDFDTCIEVDQRKQIKGNVT